MVQTLINSVSEKTSSLKQTLDNLVKAMLSAIDSKKDEFGNHGEKLMTTFSSGITRGKNTAKTALSDILSSLLSILDDDYRSWYNTGVYLVDGFAAGISAESWAAEAEAAAMAEAALEAAREALDVNSPSKVFRKLGTSVPEGFAMGIDKLGGVVTASAENMANTGLQGAKDAISKLADYVDTDIDTQPTIRPVLDLSDVASGASTISGLFNMTPSVGVLSNVGSISSMMNNNQNGANDGVIDAINGLKSVLGTNTGDTISVNGITYDDGSNIADAVKSLVRAARVERRI